MAETPTADELHARLAAIAMPRLPTRYVPHTPHPRQAVFLHLQHREAMFGGAARGGKSDALLMAALQYVDVPGYKAILFRRTYPELVALGGLIPRSKEWLRGTSARFNEGRKQWTFPSGAVLAFGHMQHATDIESHERGPEYQFIGFDELTTFQERMYTSLASRLTGPSEGPLSRVPLRFRAGTNPGGEGHDWVKRRFVTEGKAKGRAFVRSFVRDNPTVNAAEYLKSLEMLDPVTRARMERGDWDIMPGGDFFRAEWFVVLEVAPACERRVRFWDCAATTDQDNARTAGVLMGSTASGKYPILHADAFWLGPSERDRRIRAQAEVDGRDVPIRIEHEGGSGGIHQAQDQVRMLAGYDVRVVRPKGDKPERASPLARQAEVGNVPLVSSGPWIGDFLSEACAFPKAKRKDLVDAASGAFLELCDRGLLSVHTREDEAPPAEGEAREPEAEDAPRRVRRTGWSGAKDPSRGRLWP